MSAAVAEPPAVVEAEFMMSVAIGWIAVAHDDAVLGSVGVFGEGDLGGHGNRRGLCGTPGAVDGIGEHQAFVVVDDQEDSIHVRDEGLAVVAHLRDESAAGGVARVVRPG